MSNSTKKDSLNVGIDIAKSVFFIYGVNNTTGEVVELKLTRKKFEEYFVDRAPCLIAMEGCGGAQAWARLFTSQGHKVELLHARAVKMFLRGCKSDKADAQAIFRAMSDSSLHRVATKSMHTQDLETVLGLYHGNVKEVINGLNRIRGLITEYGIVMPKRKEVFFRDIEEVIKRLEVQKVSPLVITSLNRAVKMVRLLEEERQENLKLIKTLLKDTKYGSLLESHPGVGVITAAELVSKIGDEPTVFKNGRAFAAFLGICPGHTGTGGKVINIGITKRGDRKLRSLLYEGAMTRLRSRTREPWIIKLVERKPKKVAIIAIAAHTARSVWAMARYNQTYKPQILMNSQAVVSNK